RYLGARSCAFLMNSICAASSSAGATVARDATAMPTSAKNFSCPAGAQMHRSRTGFWEAFRKEWGAFAGMLMVSPARTTDFLPRKLVSISRFEDCERFFKVMPMRAWPSARRNHHIDKAIAPIGVIARQKNRVGVSHQCDVRQTLVLVRPREHQVSVQIVGRYRRDRLGGDCVLVHKSIRFWLLVAGLISSGHSCFTCEFQPRVSPIFSKAAA